MYVLCTVCVGTCQERESHVPILCLTHSLNIPAIRRRLLSQHRIEHPLSPQRERRCTRLPPLPRWRPEKQTPPKSVTSLEHLKLVSYCNSIQYAVNKRVFSPVHRVGKTIQLFYNSSYHYWYFLIIG